MGVKLLKVYFNWSELSVDGNKILVGGQTDSIMSKIFFLLRVSSQKYPILVRRIFGGRTRVERATMRGPREARDGR